MIWIQLMGIVFGVFLVYESWVFRVKGEIKKYDFLLWVLVGSALVLINVFPSSLNSILESMGFLRAFDFFTLVGFFLVLSMLLYLNRVVRRCEDKIGKIVEEIALRRKK
ncbi:MAG TPA: DUF2304 domain-containing protein [Candidatus Aenigmarchaeota archaeon]|nr:DUF2304 domain-containing protein [Candidatus Aenigmarchaeota archaeon]